MTRAAPSRPPFSRQPERDLFEAVVVTLAPASEWLGATNFGFVSDHINPVVRFDLPGQRKVDVTRDVNQQWWSIAVFEGAADGRFVLATSSHETGVRTIRDISELEVALLRTIRANTLKQQVAHIASHGSVTRCNRHDRHGEEARRAGCRSD